MGAQSLLDAQAQSILELLDAVAIRHATYVIGGACADGGMSQGSGANVAPNIDVDVARIIDGSVNGIPFEIAAGTDIDADAGDQVVWGATSGKDASAYIIVQTGAANDTPAWVMVFGDVAATGLSEYPSAADISTFITHDNWVIVAGAVYSRTADTTITVAFDHTVGNRAVTGVARTFATTESAWNE